MNREAVPTTKQVGSVFDLPGKSWRIVKENWQLFAIVNIFAILGALFTALDVGPDNSTRKYGSGAGDFSGISSSYEVSAALGLGLIIGLVVLLAAFFLYTMSIALEIRTSKGQKPALKNIFEDGKKYAPRLFGLTLLSALIVLGGLVLLIIPGIIAITKLVMSPFHLVEKDLKITDAMKASNEQSKGHAGHIWAAIGLTILIGASVNIFNIIPVIGILIGTAVTIAFSMVMVLRYRELEK